MRGPCARPELLHLIPPAGGGRPLLLTNFGLLLPEEGGPRYELVCEEYFGGRATGRVLRRTDGQLLAPGANGVYLSFDGCGFAQATGSVMGKEVLDLALTMSANASVPAAGEAVWALVKDSDTSASLHRSGDGGASFTHHQSLPSGPRFGKLMSSASDPRTLYVAGFQASTPLVLLASSDGGTSFASRPAETAVFNRPATVIDVLGVDPTNPQVLMLAAGSPAGPDEIWRSADGGATWTRVLALRGMEVQSGFVWRQGGPEGEVLVAGRELFRQPGQPPAHLYVSRDGGLSFTEVIASAETGPRYRCLAAEGTRLYACAGEDGDAFLTGVSEDGGRTWTPLASLTDVSGSKLCAQGRCLLTSTWLCDTYRAACAGLAPPEPRPEAPTDAAPPDSACTGETCDGGGNGCGCRVGDWGDRPGDGLAQALAGLAALMVLARGRRPVVAGRRAR